MSEVQIFDGTLDDIFRWETLLTQINNGISRIVESIKKDQDNSLILAFRACILDFFKSPLSDQQISDAVQAAQKDDYKNHKLERHLITFLNKLSVAQQQRIEDRIISVVRDEYKKSVVSHDAFDWCIPEVVRIVAEYSLSVSWTLPVSSF